ncbi:MAG: YeeE/YedE family protein [Desulfuromonadia bacterium]
MIPLLAAGFLLGIVSGVVMHRADFCLVRPFRDIFLFGSWERFRFLLLFVGATMLLVELGRVAGVIAPYPFPLLTPPALTTLAGGALFGVGMVLAGGCVVGTLYRMGSGQTTSLAAFMGLIAGSGLYAEFHPVWKWLQGKSTLTPALTIPHLLSLPPGALTIPLSILLIIISIRWWREGKLSYQNRARGAIPYRIATLILVAVTVASYGVVGMPLGITTSYAKIAATLERLVIPDHVASLGYFTQHPFTYHSSLAGITLTGGAGPDLDAIALIQYPLITGIVTGSFLSSRALGEFKIYRGTPMRQLVVSLAGGVLMGLGARMAPGCNVWHILGGIPILSLSSILFTLSLFPGAWIGSLILQRVVLKG